MVVNKDDIIFVDSWRQFSSLSPKIHYCSTDSILDFFRKIEGTREKCVLVSAECDFQICLQKEYFPNKDIPKFIQMIDWQTYANKTDGYHGIKIGPCVMEGKCFPQHKYVAKTDRWSHFTFDEIPEEIAIWYTTNLNCEHPKIRLIPFGINHDGPEAEAIEFVSGRNNNKGKLLYLNFQDNSVERMLCRRVYSQQKWVTVIPQPNLPYWEYLNQLSQHVFCLVPISCGIDCYRIWECLYLGVIPILQDNYFGRTLLSYDLPVLVVDNIYNLSEDLLRKVSKEFSFPTEISEKAKLSYWRNTILNDANKI